MKKNNRTSTAHTPTGRRKFLTTVTKAVGTSMVLTIPGLSFAENSRSPVAASLTVKQVIDIILKEIPGAPFATTVDTLKSGSMEQEVTGIVTTTFPTVEVIEKTAKAGANLIIVHEPTFYNGQDDTNWLEQDEVYQYKTNLIKKYKIAIWRFHDYWHAHRPDGILTGFLATLGWEKYYDANNPRIITLPKPITLRAIALHAKEKLGAPMVRFIGDPGQLCSRIGLSPGAADSRRQMAAIQQTKPDLFICGETREWETVERVRDGLQMGQKTALLVLGHAISEETGMQYLVKWLQPKVPTTKITHIAAKNPFTFV
ncbi:Nif3-like dinuclear metal center hexameric protein [Adhaeribacter aquaticus]|uniref:Nif3-like dinuclear metal center hexameric protein n=1 Tax=Adhaeribacter aquaticus TaxID=299567 RepID=UPI000411EC7F|nr:Nif3-like dinuclear metal center hexameric protein [Adhaeribacter aquaticus]